MTKYDYFIALLMNLGRQEANNHPRSYSGRHMYGKNCVGIYTEQTIAQFAYRLGRQYAESQVADSFVDELDIDSWFEDIHHDQLGHGTIVYFPLVEWQQPVGADSPNEY